jgi:hypothetical protein
LSSELGQMGPHIRFTTDSKKQAKRFHECKSIDSSTTNNFYQL